MGEWLPQTPAAQLINLGALCLALVAIGEMIRRVWKTARRLNRFLDDMDMLRRFLTEWMGDPQAVPPKPSVLQRLDSLERMHGPQVEHHPPRLIDPQRRRNPGRG